MRLFGLMILVLGLLTLGCGDDKKKKYGEGSEPTAENESSEDEAEEAPEEAKKDEAPKEEKAPTKPAPTKEAKKDDKPADPFASLNLPAGKLSAKKGDWVWAAAAKPSNLKQWFFRRSRVGAVKGNNIKVGMFGELAPAAFVYPSNTASDFKAGQAVAVHGGATVLYARVVSSAGDKVVVMTQAAKPMEKKPSELLPLKANEWQPGAVIAYNNGYVDRAATVIHVAGDDVYYATRKDGLVKKSKSDLKLVDVSKTYKKGAKVYAQIPSGMSIKFVPGKVTKVINKGAAYEVKSDEGKIFTSNYTRVMPPQ